MGPLALHHDPRVERRIDEGRGIRAVVVGRWRSKRPVVRRCIRRAEGIVYLIAQRQMMMMMILSEKIRSRHLLRLRRRRRRHPILHRNVQPCKPQTHGYKPLGRPGLAVEVIQPVHAGKRLRVSEQIARCLWRRAAREGEAVGFGFGCEARQVWFGAGRVRVARVADLAVVGGQGLEFWHAGDYGGLLGHFYSGAEVDVGGRAHDAAWAGRGDATGRWEGG